jgi:hypothetical protein
MYASVLEELAQQDAGILLHITNLCGKFLSLNFGTK